MSTVRIGVHVHAEPERLRRTLEALAAHTRWAYELLLLPDGPDAAVRAFLATLRGTHQLGTAEARGAPACFNRLVTSAPADVYVLLESGATVGPGWLDHLRGALGAAPENGLAGPSTNRAWNEQQAFPGAGGSLAEVARTAEEAARRFGGAWRRLEPLHSLGDFCYAVRREVVEAVGAAEEAYGLGPCWELDYNARAARAGFAGVWACAAYVHRAPFTVRRERAERRRFSASKHLYQDRFCALRLRGERRGYEPHCRGDACEHFAPRELIEIHRPLSAPATRHEAVDEAWPSRPPLVSCVMPTTVARREYALRAIEYFRRQDYPERELLVVDDGPPGLAEALPEDPRIRYLRLDGRRSIGAKRNLACAAARGEIVAQWDDDDWYGPERLSRQVAPLLDGSADVTALVGTVFFDLPGWAFWTCSAELHRRLFVSDVHGGTLVFRRRWWQRSGRYPDTSLAEDAAFLTRCLRRGAKLRRLPADGLFLYLRHGANAWSFPLGSYLDPAGWRRVPEPPLPPEDRAFYAARSKATPEPGIARPTPGPEPPPQPLVSCIMPTADRPRFVPLSIACFLAQDYPDRELVIVDDGSTPVEAVVRVAAAGDPRVRYVRLDGRHRVGSKRNRACELAGGEVIVHWDDDDWSAPDRLRRQVEGLLESGAEANGYDRVTYWHPAASRAWTYVYPRGSRPWVSGNSLCYRRSAWRGNRFPDVDVGEDNRFLWQARGLRLHRLDDPHRLVALIHAGNVSPKRPAPPRWRPLDEAEVRQLLGPDAARWAASAVASSAEDRL